ncbi:MAG: RNB domain-containing ribonuclease, partial [Alphaproteobacteria bacterium]
PLELEVPERKVLFGPDGRIARIATRPRLDSHKVIEEFMIAANVAAAETLEEGRAACLYRVHDSPNPEKIASLADILGEMGYRLAKGQVIKPLHFNRILAAAKGTAEAGLVHELVLRSQAIAVYSSNNIGHFGLGLRSYCHFTSPIRRYADVLVHRALIGALRLVPGAAPADGADLAAVAADVSAAERRAVAAEREALDRYAALYLAERVGATFHGRINGVSRAGLFVTLDDGGADGLVPIRTLPRDYYQHDERRHRLVGRANGRVYALGERAEVRLVEADAITGSLVLELIESAGDGRHRASPSRRRRRA